MLRLQHFCSPEPITLILTLFKVSLVRTPQATSRHSARRHKSSNACSMKQEIAFLKKCLGEVLFFEESFTVTFDGKDYECKNIIGPVVSYQKNAYKFLYEDKAGKVKKKVIARKPSRVNSHKTLCFTDKRGHAWQKSRRQFSFSDPLNFKPFGRIETDACAHINSLGHRCEFCDCAWSIVKKSKKHRSRTQTI